MTDEFQVGQTVVRYSYGDITAIGTIIKISPKRKDITVEFKNFTETFDSTGYKRERWASCQIAPMTDEIKRELADKSIIRLCISTFEKAKSNLSVESAKAILEILTKETKDG